MFLAPGLAAAGAVAVGVPLAIHLLSKTRRQPKPWAAMRFLLAAYKKKQKRMQLEQWLLLALRTLIVLVLGLALAGLRPQSFWAFLGLGGAGPVVHIVLDNTPATPAPGSNNPGLVDNGGNATGSESQNAQPGTLSGTLAQAHDALATLPANAQIWVWRLGQNAPALKAGTAAQAAETIDQTRPSGRARSLSTWLDRLAEAPAAAKQPGTQVLLFAAWGRGQDDWQAIAQANLPNFRVQTNRPNPGGGADNLALDGLATPASLVLLEDGRITLQPTLTLHRHGPTDGALARAQTTPIQLTLIHTPGSVPGTPGSGTDQSESVAVAEATVTARWSPGQAALSVQGQLEADAATLKPLLNQNGRWYLQAAVAPSASNQVAADDRRLIPLNLRPHLNIAAPGTTPGTPGSGVLAANDAASGGGGWLGLGLVPEIDGTGNMQTQPLAWGTAETLRASLAGMDALLLTQPASVPDSAWPVIAAWVAQGGVLWLTPDTDPDARGFARVPLAELGQTWKPGVAPEVLDQPVPLADSVPVPAPLQRLAPDWPALLAPVSVDRRWVLTVAPEQAANTVWLKTADGQPWLVVGPHGQGFVIATASAIDPTWTNLPARPLMVPLVQETTKRLVAGPAPGPRNMETEPTEGLGDETDAENWEQIWPVVADVADASDAHTPTDHWPGVYRLVSDAAESNAESNAAGKPASAANVTTVQLITGVEPMAGNSQTVDESTLAQVFNQGTWEAWSFWSAEGDTAAATDAQTVTKPLLWLLLVLLLLEQVLSRWFSHAIRHGESHLVGRWFTHAATWLWDHKPAKVAKPAKAGGRSIGGGR